jgi:hypothetical protein
MSKNLENKKYIYITRVKIYIYITRVEIGLIIEYHKQKWSLGFFGS